MEPYNIPFRALHALQTLLHNLERATPRASYLLAELPPAVQGYRMAPTSRLVPRTPAMNRTVTIDEDKKTALKQLRPLLPLLVICITCTSLVVLLHLYLFYLRRRIRKEEEAAKTPPRPLILPTLVSRNGVSSRAPVIPEIPTPPSLLATLSASSESHASGERQSMDFLCQGLNRRSALATRPAPFLHRRPSKNTRNSRERALPRISLTSIDSLGSGSSQGRENQDTILFEPPRAPREQPESKTVRYRLSEALFGRSGSRRGRGSSSLTDELATIEEDTEDETSVREARKRGAKLSVLFTDEMEDILESYEDESAENGVHAIEDGGAVGSSTEGEHHATREDSPLLHAFEQRLTTPFIAFPHPPSPNGTPTSTTFAALNARLFASSRSSRTPSTLSIATNSSIHTARSLPDVDADTEETVIMPEIPAPAHSRPRPTTRTVIEEQFMQALVMDGEPGRRSLVTISHSSYSLSGSDWVYVPT